MKIVITGALGHIGSSLIRELPGEFPGCQIAMIDDFSAQRYCSLFELPKAGRYQFFEGDVTETPLLPIFSGADFVVHLAALTNAAGSFQNQEKVERVNYVAAQKVAEACLHSGARLIHLSSTSVYGSASEVVDETCTGDELKPQSPYAETKLREERLLQELGETNALRFITCRFGTIFGPSQGMRFHTAVNKFCWQASIGQPISVWRTAFDQKRPYLDLRDGVRAIAHIIRQEIFDNRIYNVLTHNFTVREIVAMIQEVIPDLKIDFVDTRIMNQLSYEVRDTRFRATGFSPAGSARDGIREMLRWLDGIRPSVEGTTSKDSHLRDR